MKRKRIFLLFLFLLTILLSGCGEKVEKPEKIKDIEYTVQEESEVPEELLAKMKEKQKEPFQMTYETEGYVYIAKGYGTQSTSGYSIRVLELYESAEGIVFSSELLGPAKDEPVLQVETYPYIVIKLQNLGLDVIFE
ncbi:MAG: protease complex subunit PrcB family protein [Lachnospiraceae bacterium]|nr:protease complex subunit PrcB family protein [Lachnospiraceae bacterium]